MCVCVCVWAPDNGLGGQTVVALDVTCPASERAAAVRDLPADDAVRLALLKHDACLWPFFPEECAAFVRAAEAASHASRGPPNGASTALLSPDASVSLDTPQAQHDADTCLVGPLSAVAASLQAAVACVPSPTEPVSSPEDLEAVVTAAARLVAACERAVEDAKAYEAAVEEQLRASYERRAAARQAALLQLVEVTAGARAQVEDAIAAVARAVDEGEVANIKRAAEERGEARASARGGLEQALAACGGTNIDTTTLAPTDAAAYAEALQCLRDDVAAEAPVDALVQVRRCDHGYCRCSCLADVSCVGYLCMCVCVCCRVVVSRRNCGRPA